MAASEDEVIETSWNVTTTKITVCYGMRITRIMAKEGPNCPKEGPNPSSGKARKEQSTTHS